MLTLEDLSNVATELYKKSVLQNKNIWNCGRNDNSIRRKFSTVKKLPFLPRPTIVNISEIANFEYKNDLPLWVEFMIAENNIMVDKKNVRIVIVRGIYCCVPVSIINWVKENHIADLHRDKIYLCWEKNVPAKKR